MTGSWIRLSEGISWNTILRAGKLTESSKTKSDVETISFYIGLYALWQSHLSATWSSGTLPNNIVHSGSLYVGGVVPVGKDGFTEGEGSWDIFVMTFDFGNFVELKPTEPCTAEVTTRFFLLW